VVTELGSKSGLDRGEGRSYSDDTSGLPDVSLYPASARSDYDSETCLNGGGDDTLGGVNEP
jgi:hypothetical protein